MEPGGGNQEPGKRGAGTREAGAQGPRSRGAGTREAATQGPGAGHLLMGGSAGGIGNGAQRREAPTVASGLMAGGPQGARDWAPEVPGEYYSRS